MNSREFASRCNNIDRTLNGYTKSERPGERRCTPQQARWADDNVIDFYATYYNGKFTCTECEHEFKTEDVETFKMGKRANDNEPSLFVVCPECGKLCEVRFTRGKAMFGHYYAFGVREWHDGINVLRVYERYYNPAHKNVGEWTEVCRKYEEGEDNLRFSTLALNMCSYRCESPWRVYSEIKHRINTYYSSHSRYAMSYCNYIDESATFDPGKTYYDIPFFAKLKEIPASIIASKESAFFYAKAQHKMRKGTDRIASLIFRSDLCESLAKMGYGNMILQVSEYNYGISRDEIMTAIKICGRNKYHISDPQMYVDYLKELKELKRDLHNAHYVCPENLIDAHQQTHEALERQKARIRAKQERERFEREKQEAVKHEAEYLKSKAPYLAIKFTDETAQLNFHVIQSVLEMKEEGHAMHHCVGGYWNHENSLIIGCRDAENNRVATIEVNLRDFTIVQTRAVCNRRPEQYDLINATIMEHIGKIKDAARTQAAMNAKRKEEEMRLEGVA